MVKYFVITACVIFSGCGILPSALSEADNFSYSENHVVVLGKLSLEPEFNPELEQTTHANILGDGQILNRVSMAIGATSEPISDNMLGKQWRTIIYAQWEIPFLVEAPRRRNYLKGASVLLDSYEQDRLWFPGGFYFDVPKNAAAIYIGTLRYKRNEFNTIEAIEIIDEYDETISALKKQQDSVPQVEKSLLKKIKP